MAKSSQAEPKHQSIAALWHTYAVRCLPKTGVSPVQYRETRRAFYAGVLVLLKEIKLTVGHNTVSLDSGAERMEAYETELVEFYELVEQGKA